MKIQKPQLRLKPELKPYFVVLASLALLAQRVEAQVVTRERASFAPRNFQVAEEVKASDLTKILNQASPHQKVVDEIRKLIEPLSKKAHVSTEQVSKILSDKELSPQQKIDGIRALADLPPKQLEKSELVSILNEPTGNGKKIGKLKALAEGKPPAEIKEPDSGVSKISIDIGAISLNPVVVKIPEMPTGFGELEKNGSEGKAFARIAYEDRWAWNPKREDEFTAKAKDTKLHLSGLSDLKYDFSSSLAFYSNGDSNEASAAAIVGNSDFAIEIDQDLLFLRAQKTEAIPNEKTGAMERVVTERKSLGLGVSYAGVTNVDTFDIHNKVLVGTSFTTAWNLHKRPGRLNIKVGPAWIDTVELEGGDSSRVKLSADMKTPRYSFEPAFGVETRFSIPTGDSANLMLGSSFYVREDIPNNWNAYISMQVATDKLLGFLGLGSE